jgi:hypothetical protein
VAVAAVALTKVVRIVGNHAAERATEAYKAGDDHVLACRLLDEQIVVRCAHVEPCYAVSAGGFGDDFGLAVTAAAFLVMAIDHEGLTIKRGSAYRRICRGPQ